MSVQITAIERFTKVKQRRDDLSRLLAQFQGKLDGSRDRYNAIMRELATYGIGSVDELHNRIMEMDKQINHALDEAETLLSGMEKELNSLA